MRRSTLHLLRSERGRFGWAAVPVLTLATAGGATLTEGLGPAADCSDAACTASASTFEPAERHFIPVKEIREQPHSPQHPGIPSGEQPDGFFSRQLMIIHGEVGSEFPEIEAKEIRLIIEEGFEDPETTFWRVETYHGCRRGAGSDMPRPHEYCSPALAGDEVGYAL